MTPNYKDKPKCYGDYPSFNAQTRAERICSDCRFESDCANLIPTAAPSCFKTYPLFDPPVQNKRLCHQCDHKFPCISSTAPVGTPKTAYAEPMTPPAPASTSALAVQVAGNHYKDMKIQPLEYCHANGIGKIEGDVIAYVSRWRKKNGIEDLKKARHELDILIELEEKTPG